MVFKVNQLLKFSGSIKTGHLLAASILMVVNVPVAQAIPVQYSVRGTTDNSRSYNI
jgi:hypothetical protein